MWREINGYKYRYRINDDAEVQKFTGSKWINISPVLTWNRVYVWLRSKDGTQKRVALVRLMDDAFFDGEAKRRGVNLVHRNGIKTDCSKRNLVMMTQSEIGRIHGGRGARKTVIRYDKSGNATVYKSVKEAAKKNGLTSQSLDRRIYGGVMDPRGYRFEVEKNK